MPNGFFIIINDEQVNAFAMKKNDISVVAINAGSIKKIMYSANLMMLSDKILLGIGDMSACRENIIAEEYPITEDGDNVLLYISGDSTREAVGYMIANLAVRFMLYHEIDLMINTVFFAKKFQMIKKGLNWKREKRWNLKRICMQ